LKRIVRFVFAILSMTLIESTVVSGAPQGSLATMTTVSLGAVPGLTSLNSFPISIALDRGIFKQYNIDLNVITLPGEAQACQAAYSGSVDLAQCGVNTQIAADIKGADLIMIDNELRLPLPYQVLSAPGATTWAQLKGKNIVLSNEHAIVTYYFWMMAKAHNLEQSDFQFAFGITTSVGRLAAIKSGAAIATLVSVPASLKAEAEGYHILDSTFTAPALDAENIAGGGTIATRRWAQQHSVVVSAYILALRDAVHWIYDPANKAQVVADLVKDYQIDTPGAAEKIYAIAIGRRLFSTDLCTPVSAETGSIKAAMEVGAIPLGTYSPEQYAPNTYVESATHRRCGSR
jgi:ABC-type nitrate/sulfonate/bicarbonate transport system substrate-binding protein